VRRNSKTILFFVAVFSVSALMAAFMGTQTTNALWKDTASADGSYSFSQVWVEVEGQSLSPGIVKPSDEVASNCSAYSTCGTWVYDTSASKDAIIQMIKDDPSKPSYSIASVAKLSAKSHGSLGWKAEYQFTVSQTGDPDDKDDMWQQSAIASGLVSDPSQCRPDPSWTGTTPHHGQAPGPSFHPGVAVDGMSEDYYVCIVQTYVPVRYDNTVTATNTDFTHTSSWNATFYATKGSSSMVQPTLTIGIWIIDPLGGLADLNH